METVTPDDTPDDEAAMRKRLAALSRDLATRDGAPKAKTAQEANASSMGAAVNLGARAMSEFVAAVAVGGFIGWQLDRLFGSSPLMLILFIALGTAAGFWSVYRVAAKPGSR